MKRVKRVPSQIVKHTSYFKNDFHALSKFLYNKRVANGGAPPEKMAPERLMGSQPDIYFKPFAVVETSTIGPRLFAEYLHENCLAFFNDIADLCRLEERFSRTLGAEGSVTYSYYHSLEIEATQNLMAVSASMGVMKDNIHCYSD